jgi:hypothetical protein
VIVFTALEAPAVVSGFDDVAVMGQAIEQRGCHLGVGEDARPFPEGQVGGHQHRGALVEPADEVEQELAADAFSSSTAPSTDDLERPLTMTRAPFCASAVAIAKPIPAVLPLTSASFPFRPRSICLLSWKR